MNKIPTSLQSSTFTSNFLDQVLMVECIHFPLAKEFLAQAERHGYWQPCFLYLHHIMAVLRGT